MNLRTPRQKAIRFIEPVIDKVTDKTTRKLTRKII